jgi:AcrR family transcriptional regulator
MEKQPNSKETILDCGVTLFSEKGYEAIGILEIAEAAGITKPTLYYFYHSKEGLLRAIFEKYYGLFLDILKDTCFYRPHPEKYDEDVFPVLVNTADAYFRFSDTYRSFYLIVLSLSYAPPSSTVSKIGLPFHERQLRIVTDMFKAISAHHHNLISKETQFAHTFIAVINSSISVQYQGLAESNNHTARSLVKQFMHGIFV